jgi:hypothetical protein
MDKLEARTYEGNRIIFIGIWLIQYFKIL